ncbi:MAG: GldG family protein [Chloroflexi bacterium]|nr:GldG family protein [Chloroflexota bacterium]MCI0846895.1 GldG family protein [Chloroflexota bacterium]
MTSSSSRDAGRDAGRDADQETENQRPRDWRRRRRSERPSPETAADQAEGRRPRVDATDEVLSQPLIEFFEPAMDRIATYSGPLIFSGIIGLVTGIVVVAFISSMRLYGFIDIVIGAVLLGVVGAVLFSNVLSAFVSRTGRYGANTLILVGAFTGIVVVANIVSFENSMRMDVTATNQFSLGNRTKDVLSNLTEDVRATAFYKDERDTDSPELALRRNKVLNTLEEFDSRSSKFTYRVVDPDLKPEVVSKYFGARPTSFVTEIVVVEGMESGQFDVLQPTDANYTQLEQDLVTSTLVATGSEKKLIYFLSGHGERNIDGAASDGYAAVRSGLEGDNYQVQELNWGPTEVDVEVPLDAALLVIAGPTSSLPEAHEEALDRYLEGIQLDGTPRREHGRMIFLAEPDTPVSFKDFFADWGLLISSGYIRDVGSSVPGLPQTLSLQNFNPEAPLEITLPKGERLQPVFMPGATAIALVQDDLRTGLPLAATSANSYLINDPDRTEPITGVGAESDPTGPFVPIVRVQSIGQVGSRPPTSPPEPSEISDIIVFGDSDFLSNSSYNQGGGSDLFLNSANFLVGDYSLVSIRPKVFAFREFNLDANEYDFVRFSSWLFLPGLMGLMATFVWWVRR